MAQQQHRENQYTNTFHQETFVGKSSMLEVWNCLQHVTGAFNAGFYLLQVHDTREPLLQLHNARADGASTLADGADYRYALNASELRGPEHSDRMTAFAYKVEPRRRLFIHAFRFLPPDVTIAVLQWNDLPWKEKVSTIYTNFVQFVKDLCTDIAQSVKRLCTLPGELSVPGCPVLDVRLVTAVCRCLCSVVRGDGLGAAHG
jgi:hypothetical protein